MSNELTRDQIEKLKKRGLHSLETHWDRHVAFQALCDMALRSLSPAEPSDEPVAQAKREAFEATEKLIVEIMQDRWNDYCGDANAFPDDFTIHRGKKLEFEAGRWAGMVARDILQIISPAHPPREAVSAEPVAKPYVMSSTERGVMHKALMASGRVVHPPRPVSEERSYDIACEYTQKYLDRKRQGEPLYVDQLIHDAIRTALRESGVQQREDDLPARVLAMCKARCWSLHWTARGAYLHLEASELIEAIRGKHGDPLKESADVLIVLQSITAANGIAWSDVVRTAHEIVSDLETKPHYPGEEYMPAAHQETQG